MVVARSPAYEPASVPLVLRMPVTLLVSASTTPSPLIAWSSTIREGDRADSPVWGYARIIEDGTEQLRAIGFYDLTHS
jgi:hypothetical protein